MCITIALRLCIICGLQCYLTSFVEAGICSMVRIFAQSTVKQRRKSVGMSMEIVFEKL